MANQIWHADSSSLALYLYDIVAVFKATLSCKKFHCHSVKIVACISQLQAFSCKLALCKSYDWRGINDIIPPFPLTVFREQHYYMIKYLRWATLETRRRKSRLTLMYKLTHGLIDIDTRKYLIQHSECRTRGSHQFKFRVPYANKDVFNFSFFSKNYIADWNCLPEAVVSSSSLETF